MKRTPLGTPCEAFVDGLGVAPDALVNCGERIEPDALLAPASLVVVEILSPSSHKLDKSLKLADYFRVPSLAHYLIVDLGRRYVPHHRRIGEAPVTLSIVRDGSIPLDPPEIELATSDIFA